MIDFKVFSLIFGAFFGLVAWFFLHFTYPEDELLAIPAGLIVTILLSAIVQIILHFEEKRYRQAEARFTQAPVFKCEGVVYLGAETRGARLYLFEDSVTILSLDKKPMLEYSTPMSGLREITCENTRNGAILHLYGFEEGEEIHFFSREGDQAADRIMDAMEHAEDTPFSLDEVGQ